MLDLLLYIFGAVSVFALLVFGLPMVVYVCMRAGTAGYLISKQKFLKLKKEKCDECERSKSRKNISGPEEGGTA
jgi:hypothetical protein